MHEGSLFERHEVKLPSITNMICNGQTALTTGIKNDVFKATNSFAYHMVLPHYAESVKTRYFFKSLRTSGAPSLGVTLTK